MDLPALDDVAPQQAVAQKPAASGVMDPKMAAAFPGIAAKGQAVGAAAGGIQSEFAKEFARSYMEKMLSDEMGFPVHIPDEEEAAYRRAAQASALHNIDKQNAADNASAAISNMLKMDPKALKAAGLSVGTIAAEPEKFVAFANANKLSPQPLSLGDLFQIGVGSQEFAKQLLTFDPEARAAAAEDAQAAAQQKAYGEALTLREKQRSDTLGQAEMPDKMVQADTKTAKDVTDYIAGNGVYGPGFKEAVSGAESAFGARLTRGLAHPFDVQWDEPNGPAAGLALYNAEQNRVGPKFGSPKPVAMAFEKKFGSEIADQIEEIPLDAKGNIIAGAGSTGVDKGASLGLTAMAMRLAKDMGMKSVSDLFLKWGIKASGVNPESFIDQLLADSKKPTTEATFMEAAMRLKDYGLAEDFGPMLLQKMTGGEQAPAESKAP